MSEKDRGERKDDQPPKEFKGTGVVDKIADFILGGGLVKKAKDAAEAAEKKRKET
jgi:hypothetical protein